MGATARLRDRLMIGPAARFARDTLDELEREPADVVASEMLVVGSQIAAEAAGVPNVLLVPNVYPGEIPGSPPFGMGLTPRGDAIGRLRDRTLAAMGRRLWDRRLGDLNTLRADHGLAPLTTVFDLLDRADRVLVLTTAAFEPPGAAHLPDRVRYCGPRLDDPGWAGAWDEPSGTDPLVLVALSTTFQDQGATVRRAIDALGRLPVRGFVTTGPSIDPNDLTTPANVTVVAAAPHSAVLAHASAVVTHAGHGTVIKALAQRVPVVCLPFGRDQPDTAQRVVAARAGLRLRPSARSSTIAAAVAKVLDDPAYRAGAARIAAAIEADHRRDIAADELEAIATSPGSS
jgi:MGT family glycosyltransferase